MLKELAKDLGIPLRRHQRLPLPDPRGRRAPTRCCSASRPGRRSERPEPLEVRHRPALREVARRRCAAAFADVPDAVANTLDDRQALRPRAQEPTTTSSRPTAPTPARPSSSVSSERPGAAWRSVWRPAAASPAGRIAGPRRHAVLGAPRVRARRHQQDGVRRLLPDRLRLHQLGEGAGHPGRAWARLRRGQRSSRTRSASPTSNPLPYNLLFERFLNPEPEVDARHRRRLLLTSAATR